MGHKRHFVMIVSSADATDLAQVHATALSLFKQKVTPIVAGDINGISTFMIGPSGSQWDDSIAKDWKAAELKLIWYMSRYAFADGSSPIDWVTVQYADDNHESKLMSSDSIEMLEERKELVRLGESFLVDKPLRLPDAG